MREAQTCFRLQELVFACRNLFLPVGAHLNFEIKTFDSLDIRHLRYFKGTHTVRLQILHYLSTFKKMLLKNLFTLTYYYLH